MEYLYNKMHASLHYIREKILTNAKYCFYEYDYILYGFLLMNQKIIRTDYESNESLFDDICLYYQNEYKDEIDTYVKEKNSYVHKCFLESIKKACCNRDLLQVFFELKRLVDDCYDSYRKYDEAVRCGSALPWERKESPTLYMNRLHEIYRKCNYNKPSRFNSTDSLLFEYACVKHNECFYVTKDFEVYDNYKYTKLTDMAGLTHDGICDILNSGFIKLDVSYVWDFHEGFARVLSKHGVWGFLSKEDLKIRWFEKAYYLEEFSCERALMKCADEFNPEQFKYFYLDQTLNIVNEEAYVNAENFKEGIAVVSDKYCSNFRINVCGCVIDGDKKRYEESKHPKCKKKRGTSFDPESDVMNSFMNGTSEYYGY